MTNSSALDNLVKTGKLKAEPADQDEFKGLVTSAKHRLEDSRVESLSIESQFDLAYGAAHALALAALRMLGYRASSRYLVFQCLEHTLGLEKAKWRILDKCHKQRNLAEYEGHLEITPELLSALQEVATELLTLLEQ